MGDLLVEHAARIARFKTTFKRYLFEEIDINNRLIAIKGARGTGKTTLLLQLAQQLFPKKSTLYVSLDHLYFYENSLYELAKQFEQHGGTHLLLDEVHKYLNWSRELKLIYDNFPDLHVVFTSSSSLEIYKAESDLSRRAITYNLKELSFREFVALETGVVFPVYSFQTIVEQHTNIATEFLAQFKPLPLFEKYLKIGAYPYYKENEHTFTQKLLNTINLIIEVDINAVENLNYETLVKLKKLLKTVASSAPFTPNISKLAPLVGLSRNALVQAIKILERAGLVNELFKPTTGIGVLTKPEKLFLNNTNLMYTLAQETVNIGNLRETFFFNQVKGKLAIHLPETGDFLVDNKWTIEIGGKNKKQKQILNLPDAYVAKDNIEIGVGNQIPIWVFGLMY